MSPDPIGDDSRRPRLPLPAVPVPESEQAHEKLALQVDTWWQHLTLADRLAVYTLAEPRA